MMNSHADWGKAFCAGALAGLLWGMIALAIDALTGVFPLENKLLFNIVSFSVGGAIFGVVLSGFMIVLQGRLPFSSPLPKAIVLSTGLWFLLRLGGFFLSLAAPERYHPNHAQTLQGLLLAVALGLILGGLFGRLDKENV